MKKIFLFEDDDAIRENYCELLTEFGYQVSEFCEPNILIESVQAKLPDLVILDITMGDDRTMGFDVCVELRKISQHLPIIFLTSHVSLPDKISGLRLGADDYVTKEVDSNYLVVRIESLLKRRQIMASADMDTTTISVGSLDLDESLHTTHWKEQAIKLSLTQFWILASLVKRPGHVKTYQQLMESAGIVVERNTIATHIKDIRNQFVQIDDDFACIQTERGLGYKWMADL